mmetsp:Transcript_59076/g.106151  ORF Transcript_59076/g.106151 Transcript_59076/m.106151 type:complete len:270 (-) Transcript_59076:9-818(-)
MVGQGSSSTDARSLRNGMCVDNGKLLKLAAKHNHFPSISRRLHEARLHLLFCQATLLVPVVALPLVDLLARQEFLESRIRWQVLDRCEQQSKVSCSLSICCSSRELLLVFQGSLDLNLNAFSRLFKHAGYIFQLHPRGQAFAVLLLRGGVLRERTSEGSAEGPALGRLPCQNTIFVEESCDRTVMVLISCTIAARTSAVAGADGTTSGRWQMLGGRGRRTAAAQNRGEAVVHRWLGAALQPLAVAAAIATTSTSAERLQSWSHRYAWFQ